MIFFKMPDFVTSPSQPVKSKDFYLKKENQSKTHPRWICTYTNSKLTLLMETSL